MSRRSNPSTQLITIGALSILLVIVAIILVLEIREYGPELQQVVVPEVEEDVGR